MNDYNQYLLATPNADTVILLMHSLGDNRSVIEPLAVQLFEAGYDVFYPTYTSHEIGKIEKVMLSDFESYQKDAESYYQWLVDKGYQQIFVGGLSIGGLLSFDLACKYPQIAGIISLATPIFTDLNNTKIPYFIRQQYFQSLQGEIGINQRKFAEELFAEFKKNLSLINQWMEDNFEKIMAIEAPVFIAQGRQDEVISLQLAKRLERALRLSKVSLNIYEEGSHYLTENKTVKDLSDDILIFLAN